MSAVTETGVLSPEAESVLEAHGLYSRACVFDGLRAYLFNDDDRQLAVVTRDISHFDLEQLIGFAQREYTRGQRAGREVVQAQLRNLIGAIGKEDAR